MISRWALMWCLAAALFCALKVLSWWPERHRFRSRPAWLRFGYLAGWVGLDPAPFLGVRSRVPPPAPRDWLVAVFQAALGAALVWTPLPGLDGRFALERAWIGLVGVAFLLHFGFFRLLALGWRRLGVPVRPIMANPAASRSLAEFWGRRWNLAFRDVSYRFLFRPLRSRLGSGAALLAVFLASGLVHELVISLPAGAGWGLPTLYFLLQGVAMTVERRVSPGRRHGMAGRVFALGLAALPAPLLFHPPFVREVALPFFNALGAPFGAAS